MKVIVKKPSLDPEVIEVENISEINKLVGNLDKDGNGLNHGGSDIRMEIFEGIDQYVNQESINNFALGENLWAPNNNALFFGTIVFAGYDKTKSFGNEVCSLTDEQIKICMEYIARQAF